MDVVMIILYEVGGEDSIHVLVLNCPSCPEKPCPSTLVIFRGFSVIGCQNAPLRFNSVFQVQMRTVVSYFLRTWPK